MRKMWQVIHTTVRTFDCIKSNASHCRIFLPIQRQYCGEYYDSDSGLIYLRNRYYDCETGSFINEDPARSGVNWYSYCNGNPVMFCDPLGMESGRVIDFISDLSQIYGSNYKLSQYNYVDKNNVRHSGVTLKMGSDIYGITKDLGYNGYIAISDGSSYHFEKLMQNDNGVLKAERTDFYRALGVPYECGGVEFDVTKAENTAKGLTFDGIVTYGLYELGVSNVVARFIISSALSIAFESQLTEPWHYKVEAIVAEVYDKSSDTYSSIVTYDVYVQKENEDGNKYWKQVTEPVTKYNGKTESSILGKIEKG